MSKRALLIVDVQNDFCPGGALPVPNGDEIVPVVNMLIAIAKDEKIPIFASRDWHPQNHCSFKKQGGPWPPHCVQSTVGAELHPELRLPLGRFTLISKGIEPNKDSYSAFGDTELLEELKKRNIKELWICGLATDYCVKATALDAKKLGFDVVVIENACAAVKMNPGDEIEALNEMLDAGIEITNFAKFAFR